MERRDLQSVGNRALFVVLSIVIPHRSRDGTESGAFAALPFDVTRLPCEEGHADEVAKVRGAVSESINCGVPVVYRNEEEKTRWAPEWTRESRLRQVQNLKDALEVERRWLHGGQFSQTE